MSAELKRGPNSKGKRDPELTRRRLLEAAIKLFAEKGRDGTSVDEICRVSGVNCRMIYHYFGSKDGLYMAMLRRVYGRIREIVVDVDENALSLSEFVEKFTERYFRFLQSNPEFVAILRWENASGAKGICQLELGDFRSRCLEAASRALEQADDEGSFVAMSPSSISENSLLIVLTCCALCGYYFSNQASLGHVMGIDLTSSDFSEQWLAHIKQSMRARFCEENLFGAETALCDTET